MDVTLPIQNQLATVFLVLIEKNGLKQTNDMTTTHLGPMALLFYMGPLVFEENIPTRWAMSQVRSGQLQGLGNWDLC